MAAKLPGPPHDIKNVFRNSLIGPYRKEIVYKISVFDLLQSMESKEVFSKQATRGRGTQIMHRELIRYMKNNNLKNFGLIFAQTLMIEYHLLFQEQFLPFNLHT